MMRNRHDVEPSGERPPSCLPRFALAGLAAFLCVLMGCSSPPDIHYYDIRLPDPPPATSGQDASSSVGPLPIRLVGVDLPAHLDLPEIFYRKSLYQAGYYDYHRWVRPLSESLEAELVRYLEKTGHFAVICDRRTDRDPAALRNAAPAALHIKVIEFNENDGQGDLWTVEAEFLVRIDNLPGGTTRRATLARSFPVSRRNAAGTVEALNLVFAEIVGDIVLEFGGVHELRGEK
jgi:ABC-type uncharacterized transport system auxiliary subunit